MTPFSKAFCSLSPLPWSLFCAQLRLTGGTENTLFHYVSWDSFHGIVVCPSDGDTPSTSGPVHAEVLNTFHKTCLSMRRLFSPYYKQVSSKTRYKYYALTTWVDSQVSLWVTVLTLHQFSYNPSNMAYIRVIFPNFPNWKTPLIAKNIKG